MGKKSIIARTSTFRASASIWSSNRTNNLDALYGIGRRSKFVRNAKHRRVQLCCNCRTGYPCNPRNKGGANESVPLDPSALAMNVTIKTTQSNLDNTTSKNVVNFSFLKRHDDEGLGENGVVFLYSLLKNTNDNKTLFINLDDNFDKSENFSQVTIDEGFKIVDNNFKVCETTNCLLYKYNNLYKKVYIFDYPRSSDLGLYYKNWYSITKDNVIYPKFMGEDDTRPTDSSLKTSKFGDQAIEFDKTTVEANIANKLPYKIMYLVDEEYMNLIGEVGVSTLIDVRSHIESLIKFSPGYKWGSRNADLYISVEARDLGPNINGQSTMAMAFPTRVAKSVFSDKPANFPIAGTIVININPTVYQDRLVNTKCKFNSPTENKTNLFAILMHEFYHILCISNYASENFGWASKNLGLITKPVGASRFFYKGKKDSKAVAFYKEHVCDNKEIYGIPIEDDTSGIKHFEEGLKEGNVTRLKDNDKEHYPVPYELTSTYHQGIVFMSIISAGVLEDYGYVINHDDDSLKMGNQLYINAKNKMKAEWNITLGEAFLRNLKSIYG